MKRNIFILSYFLAASTLFSCSSTKPQQQFTNLFRKSEAEAVSTAMKKVIEEHYTLLQHPLVSQYIDSLGQNIISHNPQMPPLSYQFRVLRSNELNAFSTPNGTVYIALGFLSIFELEAQLASVIAHELAHHEASHPADTWRKKIFKHGELPQIANYETNETFQHNYFSNNGYLYYGPSYEFDADEIAVTILYHAGFDPRAYLSYLEELQKINLKNPSQVENIQKIHPPFSERIELVKNYLKQLPPQKEARLNSATFKEIKSRLQLVHEAVHKKKNQGKK